jgi:alkylation response protein AidB-like acyl-CoA dehydrogenase
MEFEIVEPSAVLVRAKEVATTTLAPAAAKNDAEGRFSQEAVDACGKSGLLGLLVPKDRGGAGLGPRAVCDVIAAFAEVDPSAAMVFLMHACGTAVLAASTSPGAKAALGEIAKGTHLTTLAFSEAGSRSHFWAPMSRAQKTPGGARLNAKKSWVTSAGHAQSYVVSTLSADGKGPTDSTIYLVRGGSPGISVSGGWNALGMRANASTPMALEAYDVKDDDRVSDEGAGFKTMLEVVLPLFSAGQTALAVGICRGVVGATVNHLKTARFEHLGASLGEALPTLRARLAQMQIDTDGLAARLSDLLGHLEAPGELTVLRVLEAKAAAGDTAVRVTSDAMHACGGAAFSKHLGIERLFRDAHACAVMAPTGDVLREFIGKALLGIPLF